MIRPIQPQSLLEYIGTDKKILILASDPLDFDSIGSSLTLKKYLESLGKQVRVVFPRKINIEEKDYYSILPFLSEIEDHDTRELFLKKIFDVIIFVDGTNLVQYYDSGVKSKATPNLASYDKRIKIDHHLTNTEPLGTLAIHDPKSSSAAEIILEQILPEEFIDQNIATLIYGAIVGDTGNFCWNITSKTLKHAQFLLEKGAQAYPIIERMFFYESKDYLKMLSFAIEKIEYDDEISTSFLCLPYQTILKYQLSGKKMDNLKKAFKEGVARKVKGYARGIMIIESIPNEVHISSRGNNLSNKISLPNLLQTLGGNGGGHFNAASADVKGNFNEVKEKLVELIKNQQKG